MTPDPPADQEPRPEEYPKTLYHYTDANGLYGIVNEGAIWASDARYLNDSEEISYAKEALTATLRQFDNPAVTEGHPFHHVADQFGETFGRFIEMVIAQLNDPGFAIYVACFTTNSDQLSQWRAYGSSHSYCVGFDLNDFARQIQSPADWMPSGIFPVRYGVEGATETLSKAAIQTASDSNLGHVGVHAYVWALRLTATLAQVKHPGFREEGEWRAILATESRWSERVRYRPDALSIIPYVPIPTPSPTSVRVGPSSNAGIRAESVSRFLTSKGISVPVETSQIPYRA